MAGVTVGVDLGGTKIQSVAMRAKKVAGSYRAATPQTGADNVTVAIIESVQKGLAEAGASPSDLRAVGIGAPGQIDRKAGTVASSPNLPGFQDAEPVDLGPRVSKGLAGVPVTIDNDVRVAILGEYRRGAGRPYKDVMGVWVGTGVGGGLVLDGKLREGHGAAGEIGHTIVRPGGRMCSDGRRGHLEAYAGRGRMEARAHMLEKQGEKTVLFQIMKKKGRERASSGVIAEALEQGDAMTIQLIDDAVWALGVALASAQNLLDLEAIIIGGGLGDRLGAPFVARIANEMQPRLFVPDRPPAMLTTQFGDLSGAVGAAVLAGG
jgi:glucokinase